MSLDPGVTSVLNAVTHAVHSPRLGAIRARFGSFARHAAIRHTSKGCALSLPGTLDFNARQTAC